MRCEKACHWFKPDLEVLANQLSSRQQLEAHSDRVQEQDTNANGYLDLNVSSIGILQMVLMMMIANVQDCKQVVPY